MHPQVETYAKELESESRRLHLLGLDTSRAMVTGRGVTPRTMFLVGLIWKFPNAKPPSSVF